MFVPSTTTTAIAVQPPKQLATAEIPIELVFPLFIVFIVLCLGVEKKYPRNTTDLYWADVARRAEREGRKKAADKFFE